MRGGGRPLRFLAMTLGGWTAIRVACLMPPTAPLPTLMGDVVAPPAAASTSRAEPSARPIVAPIPSERPPSRMTGPRGAGWVSRDAVATRSAGPFRASAGPSPMTPPPPPPHRERMILSPLSPIPAQTGARAERWSASAWLLVRGGAGGTVSGGQLGASQAGVRVLHALGGSGRVAIAARLATPLRGRGREAAVGFDWRPTDWPIHVIAEQRFVLDGGRGGPTLGIVGGYGPVDVAPGLRVEAYGQAGTIARDGVEGFVDAAARVSHAVARAGDIRLDIGIGAWGSAQRAAERLDVGPSIGVAIPVEARSLRVNLDWRQRIAGKAHPGSGPALSIGADF